MVCLSFPFFDKPMAVKTFTGFTGQFKVILGTTTPLFFFFLGGGEGVSSVSFKPSCAGVSGGVDDEVRYDSIWSRGKQPTE